MTSDDIPIRDPDQIHQDCARKLRAVEISDPPGDFRMHVGRLDHAQAG